MVTKFNTEIELYIRGEGRPIITYGINNSKPTTATIVDKDVTLKFNVDLDIGTNEIFVDFNNKTNDTPDMAVIIEAVTVEGFCLDRFKWAGIYTPIYPEPWASQQVGPLPPTIPSATYMGWNGRWSMTFTVPIFTWIHQLEHLGWIYE